MLRRGRVPVLALVAALLLAGCSGSGPDGEGASGAGTDAEATSTSGDTATSTTDPSEAGSEGCGRPEPGPGGERTLTHDGWERGYVVHLPEERTDEPAPLVFNLHGFGGTIASQDERTELPDLAGARGYVVVTPQGLALSVPEQAPQAGQAGDLEGLRFWNFFGSGGIDFGGEAPPGLDDLSAEDVGVDDVGFFDALLDRMLVEHCIDPGRVFSTGMSNGAGMSTALGCELGDRFAAIAPVSGVNLTGSCPGDDPVSVLAIHGGADEVAAYEGGSLMGFELGNPSAPDRMAAWAEHDGCDPDPERVRPHEGLVVTRWTGCAEGTVVELWTITGWGHRWPRADTPAEPGVIDATEVILDFFGEVPSAHAAPTGDAGGDGG